MTHNAFYVLNTTVVTELKDYVCQLQRNERYIMLTHDNANAKHVKRNKDVEELKNQTS